MHVSCHESWHTCAYVTVSIWRADAASRIINHVYMNVSRYEWVMCDVSRTLVGESYVSLTLRDGSYVMCQEYSWMSHGCHEHLWMCHDVNEPCVMCHEHSWMSHMCHEHFWMRQTRCVTKKCGWVIHHMSRTLVNESYVTCHEHSWMSHRCHEHVWITHVWCVTICMCHETQALQQMSRTQSKCHELNLNELKLNVTNSTMYINVSR